MIVATKDFLDGYEFAIQMVKNGIKDMKEYDLDDQTLDVINIYLDALRVVRKVME